MIAKIPTVNSSAKVSINKMVYCKNKKILKPLNCLLPSNPHHNKNVSIILDGPAAATKGDNEGAQTDENEGPGKKLQQCVVELVQRKEAKERRPVVLNEEVHSQRK